MPGRFFVHNLGCKVNRAESDTITTALLCAGGISGSREDADVVVINTCTVTAEAEAKTRKAIRRVAKDASHPWVIATGCAIAIDKEAYEALGTRVIAEPDRLCAQQRALELLGLSSRTDDSNEVVLCQGDGFHTRRGIKIQDGCDNSCTYCVVRIARGPAVSMSLSDICRQVQGADRQGIREIILTGVNIGAYQYENQGLTALIRKLLDSTSKLRLRLSSLEPQHVSDELLELMAESKGRLCAHLHLPLQSGCDRILREMGRSYDAGFYVERVDRARALMPHLALTTDVIVGFPGESEMDFDESLTFCEERGFSRMHIFRYSGRPGTSSAQMPEQVPSKTAAIRAAKMRELADRLQALDVAGRVGHVETVLVERSGHATSESYHRVEVPAKAQVGSLIPVKFIDCRDNLLYGSITGANGRWS